MPIWVGQRCPQKIGHWSFTAIWTAMTHGNSPTKNIAPCHHRIQSTHPIDKCSWPIHQLSCSWKEFSWRSVKALLMNSNCGWACILANKAATTSCSVEVKYRLYYSAYVAKILISSLNISVKVKEDPTGVGTDHNKVH